MTFLAIVLVCTAHVSFTVNNNDLFLFLSSGITVGNKGECCLSFFLFSCVTAHLGCISMKSPSSPSIDWSTKPIVWKENNMPELILHEPSALKGSQAMATPTVHIWGNLEDFTLPHIFQVDSAGVQVILQSPPGVQLHFFWLGAQPNWHA